MRPEIRPFHQSHKFRIVVLIIVAAVIGFIIWRHYHQSGGVLGRSVAQRQQEATLPAVNGTLVTPAIAQTRPIGVMIENSPEARPQSGLAEADIVYETLAEGGITRFLAIFQSQSPDNIGPVRSARDYYAQLANEWGVLYAHVGGSDEVLAQLTAGKYKNLTDANQFYYGNYFKRVASPPAPHNVYTSIEKLREIISDKKFDANANFEPWQFAADTPPNDTAPALNANTISIKFSGPLFDVKYIYDGASKKYGRLLAGKPHLDAETKDQLTADTVIVQYVSITATPNDPKERIDLGLVGQGKAFIFHNGVAIQGQWKKTGIAGRTQYYTADGRPLTLTPGKIWIELTNPGTMTYQPPVAKPATNQ